MLLIYLLICLSKNGKKEEEKIDDMHINTPYSTCNLYYLYWKCTIIIFHYGEGSATLKAIHFFDRKIKNILRGRCLAKEAHSMYTDGIQKA